VATKLRNIFYPINNFLQRTEIFSPFADYSLTNTANFRCKKDKLHLKYNFLFPGFSVFLQAQSNPLKSEEL